MRIVTVFVLLLLAVPLYAQIDPDPDGIGVYLDEAATRFCGSTPIGEILLSPSTGDFDLPVMVLDGECGVAAEEDRSWGEVKRLFR